MRHLSAQEAEVIRSMLAALPGTEEDRIRTSSIPRSTYQTVRRRALEAGWITERFVPSPPLLGGHSIRITLSRPFAEEWQSTIRLAEADPCTVFLAAGAQVILIVRFVRTHGTDDFDNLSDRESSILIQAPGSGVPVYFDLEGAWSFGVLGGSPLRYPHGLPGGWDDCSHRTTEIEAISQEAAMALFGSTEGVAQGPLPRGLERKIRELLEQNMIIRRTFLQLGRVPSLKGREIEQVVLVTGQCASPPRSRALLAALAERTKVYPFLFAYDEGRVLLAALAPLRASPAREPSSVMDVLGEHLTRVESVREPLAAWEERISHRYWVVPESAPKLRQVAGPTIQSGGRIDPRND